MTNGERMTKLERPNTHGVSFGIRHSTFFRHSSFGFRHFVYRTSSVERLSMNYIYETPWWLPTGIALLGVILFVTGNNRLEKRLRIAGIIVIAFAVILALVS